MKKEVEGDCGDWQPEATSVGGIETAVQSQEDSRTLTELKCELLLRLLRRDEEDTCGFPIDLLISAENADTIFVRTNAGDMAELVRHRNFDMAEEQPVIRKDVYRRDPGLAVMQYADHRLDRF